MRTTAILLAVACALLACAVDAPAQATAPAATPRAGTLEGSPPSRRGEAAGLRERFVRRGGGRILLALRIAEALDLDEQQTIRVATQLRAIQDRRRALVDERNDLETRLASELAKPSPDRARLESLTADVAERDRNLALLPEEAFDEIAKGLTPEQRAKLVLLRSKLKAQVQSERDRRARAADDADEPASPPPRRPKRAP
ncbi:MAG TPA: hypothetical protein VFD92_07800 [Candidatus Binatia bacterium]|nr:hypothetical protein [Candidatus Binatia bacterium]